MARMIVKAQDFALLPASLTYLRLAKCEVRGQTTHGGVRRLEIDLGRSSVAAIVGGLDRGSWPALEVLVMSGYLITAHITSACDKRGIRLIDSNTP